MSINGVQIVTNILVKRDGMDLSDARELVEDTIEEINEAISNGDDDLVEDILAGNLGLELDYIFYLI